MSSNRDENGSDACQRIEEFIFVRELNEVFLLLDHISGRWDKSLYNFQTMTTASRTSMNCARSG